MSNYSEDQALLVKLINADCFKDYYTILGVDKNRTSAEEIRKAYKNLCLRVHPDKNKAPGADEAFKKVNEAYRNLISTSNSNSNPNPKPRRYNNSSNSNPNPKPRRDSDLDLDLDLAVFFMVVGGVVVVVCVTVYLHRPVPIYRGSTQMQMSTGPGKFILLTATAIAGICMWWN